MIICNNVKVEKIGKKSKEVEVYDGRLETMVDA